MSTASYFPVIVAGGGPAGLVVAMELGRRGVPVLVLEQRLTPPCFPKANATTSRSMEHYRRLGFAKQVRAMALPEGYPADIAYLTRYAGSELARLSGEGMKPDPDKSSGGDRWPSREPLARVQQMHVEQVILDQALRIPSVEHHHGWRVLSVRRADDGWSVEAEHVETGERKQWQSEFLVGADGPRSLVRETMGIKYVGHHETDRDFLGGDMMATYFRSDEFYRITGERSWQYWAVNTQQRGLICAINGQDLFVHHVQLAPDQPASVESAKLCLTRAMGREFNFEILGVRPWTAGFTLVAERLSDSESDPRAFIVGDAAHLFTPTGGMGYNTAVDDAVNLGWKLAAVCKGWAPFQILASYDPERRAIAQRNTGFARRMAESIGRMPVPENLEDEDQAGADARKHLGARLFAHAQSEFDVPGMAYGVFYGPSPIVIGDGAPPPPDEHNRYVPSSIPGARAPHVRIGETESIHDLFGDDFTLLTFSRPTPAEKAELDTAIAAAGIPLKVVDINDASARNLYGYDRVLVRPDQHVAWRGAVVPHDFAQVLRKATGWPAAVQSAGGESLAANLNSAEAKRA